MTRGGKRHWEDGIENHIGIKTEGAYGSPPPPKRKERLRKKWQKKDTCQGRRQWHIWVAIGKNERRKRKENLLQSYELWRG